MRSKRGFISLFVGLVPPRRQLDQLGSNPTRYLLWCMVRLRLPRIGCSLNLWLPGRLTGFQIWDMRSRFSAILSNNAVSAKERARSRERARQLQKLCRDRAQKQEEPSKNKQQAESEPEAEAKYEKYIHKIFYAEVQLQLRLQVWVQVQFYR